MSFVVRNDPFECLFCGAKNTPAPQTCRNHCSECLASLHVDLQSPGDRLSSCHGKMLPIAVESHPQKGWVIVHQCEKCGVSERNKSAVDDDFEALVSLAQRFADQITKSQG